MSEYSSRILIADNNFGWADTAIGNALIRLHGVRVVRVSSFQEACAELTQPCDLLICKADIRILGDVSRGAAFVDAVRQISPATHILMVTSDPHMLGKYADAVSLNNCKIRTGFPGLSEAVQGQVYSYRFVSPPAFAGDVPDHFLRVVNRFISPESGTPKQNLTQKRVAGAALQ